MCLLKIIAFVCGLRKFLKNQSLRKNSTFPGFIIRFPAILDRIQICCIEP